MSHIVAPARAAFSTAVKAQGMHTTAARAAPSLIARGLTSRFQPTTSAASSSFCTASYQRRPAPKAVSLPRSASRLLSTSAVRRDDAAQSKGTPIGQIEQRLSLTFTCAVSGCGHRSTHEFSKRSYERGIVLVQCPGCNNR